jgi:DNA-binding NtrC family response regulator
MAAIVIIDDDPAVSGLLQEALSRAGHRATVCRDGREVLARLKAGEADLLITDIFMDETEGLELITQAKAARPELKIIAMSGGTDLTDRDYLPIASKLGAHATFHKPLNVEHLLQKIAQLLRQP